MLANFSGSRESELVSVTDKEARTALAAFSRYGYGRGHPAQLNLGDCFAYAMAKHYRTMLLFKGEDFDKTDLRPAARMALRRALSARMRTRIYLAILLTRGALLEARPMLPPEGV